MGGFFVAKQTTQTTLLQRWTEGLAGALHIPADIAHNVPKATLIGPSQLQIENHRGIIEYTPQRVRIQTRIGPIVVQGSHLRIGSIFHQEMLLEGRIASVQLVANEGIS